MTLEYLMQFSMHLGIHLLFIIIAVFGLYHRYSKNRQFCFSFVAISISVFILCYALQRVDLELGFALGLFAVFGIIRYRTITIPTKEMTYLFVVIGLSVVNSLTSGNGSPWELLIVNGIVVLSLLFLEWFSIKENLVVINYEKVENLMEGNQHKLVDDLQKRTGHKVKRFEVESIDYMRDTALLHVTFLPVNPSIDPATRDQYEESFQTTQISQPSLR